MQTWLREKSFLPLHNCYPPTAAPEKGEGSHVLLLNFKWVTRNMWIRVSAERSFFFFTFWKDGDDPNSGDIIICRPHMALQHSPLLDFGLLASHDIGIPVLSWASFPSFTPPHPPWSPGELLLYSTHFRRSALSCIYCVVLYLPASDPHRGWAGVFSDFCVHNVGKWGPTLCLRYWKILLDEWMLVHNFLNCILHSEP